MADPEIPQPDTSSDSSDELQSLLAQYEAETSRPAASNGREENAAGDTGQSEIGEPEIKSGDDIDWLLKQNELSDKELDLRIQRVELEGKEKLINGAIESYVLNMQQAQHDADMEKTISQVRGDLDPKFFDDKLVQAFIDKEARDNPRLQELWQNRLHDPRPLAVAIKQLSKDFNSTYSRMPDPNLTEDRNAVAAAVRGASTKAPAETAPNYSNMSNSELRDEYKRLGINPTF